MAKGSKLSKVTEEATEYAKELHKRGVDALQFRTDGGKVIKEDAEKVQDAGHEIHPGLLK
jgi:uroporphyrinogen-III decarboxylase